MSSTRYSIPAAPANRSSAAAKKLADEFFSRLGEVIAGEEQEAAQEAEVDEPETADKPEAGSRPASATLIRIGAILLIAAVLFYWLA